MMDGVIVLQTIEKCSYTWGFSTIGLICGIFAIDSESPMLAK